MSVIGEWIDKKIDMAEATKAKLERYEYVLGKWIGSGVISPNKVKRAKETPLFAVCCVPYVILRGLFFPKYKLDNLDERISKKYAAEFKKPEVMARLLASRNE